jgi:L-threonylcarbamoyladenylate synthase
VLPRATEIPDVVTAGGVTVGVRWPSHPFVQALIRACGFPLAAPSANLSGRISPTTAEHVRKSLGRKIPLIIDGGPSQVGIESTVADLTVKPIRVLRPGMIHLESLVAAAEEEVAMANSLEKAGPTVQSPLRSPGQVERHYAPRAKLSVLSWRDQADLASQISHLKFEPSRSQIIAHTRIPLNEAFGRVSVIPHDPEAFARAFFAELHRCDEAGAELIVVEAVPDTPEWEGIRDRLRRAAR